jgi:hypothetical protein
MTFTEADLSSTVSSDCLLHTVYNRPRKLSQTKSTKSLPVMVFKDSWLFGIWFLVLTLCEYIPSSLSLWAWCGGWQAHWCMEGSPALWLQLSRGQVVSRHMWGSVASDYLCSSTSTKGIPSHKNLLEWVHQDHLPKRKDIWNMSICFTSTLLKSCYQILINLMGISCQTKVAMPMYHFFQSIFFDNSSSSTP